MSDKLEHYRKFIGSEVYIGQWQATGILKAVRSVSERYYADVEIGASQTTINACLLMRKTDKVYLEDIV